jgi:CRP-like cAMP-binding protein
VATLGPGTIFGEMGLVGQDMHSKFAEAIEDCLLCVMSLQGYTHQDLAEAVGTYRETATQTLTNFKAKQLIEIGRKQIDILNPAGLEQIPAE